MKSVSFVKLPIEVPSSTVGKNKDEWRKSELNRVKGRSKVMINRRKRKEYGPTFVLDTYNRFDVLNSDDDKQESENSSDGLLCGELATNKIMEVGNSLTNKVISANKFSLLTKINYSYAIG